MGISVGISILPSLGEDTWRSSLNQGAGFLAASLARLPAVKKVFLLDGGDAGAPPPWPAREPVDAPVVRPHEVTREIDLVIEMGAALPAEWLRHVHARGARIVTLVAGPSYAGHVEAAVFDLDRTAALPVAPRHEIWTYPHHMKTSGPMLATLGRAPVHAVPQVWSPFLVRTRAEQLQRAGHRFGFDAARCRRQPWRIGIFEPNTSVAKNCFVPMLLCDQAFRLRQCAVGFMMVLSSLFMARHPTFNRLIASLELTRAMKASYEPSVPFADCMASQHIDAVIAHQWESDLDSMYFEALCGGYPLVHNSPTLHEAGVGLYYPGFEARRGAQVLLDAWDREPGFWGDYTAKSRAFLGTLAPHAPANLAAYAHRIEALMGRPR